MQNKAIASHPYKVRSKTISDRELSVLNLIAEGHSSAEIAAILFLSHETISSHRKNMMKKLAVSNTASLITMSFRTGLLTLY